MVSPGCRRRKASWMNRTCNCLSSSNWSTPGTPHRTTTAHDGTSVPVDNWRGKRGLSCADGCGGKTRADPASPTPPPPPSTAKHKVSWRRPRYLREIGTFRRYKRIYLGEAPTPNPHRNIVSLTQSLAANTYPQISGHEVSLSLMFQRRRE